MVGGIVKTSLIDYPGKIACVIFLKGCNFRCPYCHNRSLVLNEDNPIKFSEIALFLEKRRHQLEAVVITGGEPTINHNFYKIIKYAKSLGYLVKVDTNGSHPKVIKDIIEQRLVDYIAMDIKTTIKHYADLTRVDIPKHLLHTSINLIKQSGIDHEFRTTVVSDFHKEIDFNEIGLMINGAKKYVIQNYRYSHTQLNHKQYTPFSQVQLKNADVIMRKYVNESRVNTNF